DQTSTGYRVRTVDNAPAFFQVEDGDKYTRFLPSLNLIFDLGDTTKLRFGAARTLARARMDQLNASMTLNTDITKLASTDPNQAFFSASGGNAKLKPTL